MYGPLFLCPRSVTARLQSAASLNTKIAHDAVNNAVNVVNHHSHHTRPLLTIHNPKPDLVYLAF
jgi:hypothetical protein